VATTTTTAPIPATTIAALAAIVAAAVVAIAVGVAVSVGSAVAAAVQSSNQANQNQGQVTQFLAGGGVGGFFNTQTPVNDVTIPVLGKDQPGDGCGDSPVRFQDGRCYPVLKRGPCDNPYDWITVDPVSLTVKFLCGKRF